MKTKITLLITAASLVVLLMLWAPWITDDYSINQVVEKLGGPDAHFNYLVEDTALKDIPKQVSWLPFGRYVTFPSEAGWFVTFYGSVL